MYSVIGAVRSSSVSTGPWARESQNFRFDKFVTIWRFKLKINDLY